MKNKKIVHLIILGITLLALGGCNQPFSMFVNNSAFLTFGLAADNNGELSTDITGVISNTVIILNLPSGTEVTSLAPSFTFLGREVRVGTEVQESGVTAHDFSSPVVYTVVAWSGVETEYIVSAVAETGGGGGTIPATSWAKTLSSIPGSGEAAYNDVAVDGDGNVYAVGYQGEQDGIGFGYEDEVMASGPGGFQNAVIVKYSADGTTLWARTLQSALGSSGFNAVAVDASGNVYAAGYQNGNTKYTYSNGVNITGDAAGYNAVLVKYSSDGTAQWARTSIGIDITNSQFYDIALDSSGNIYTVGYQEGGVSYEYGGSASVAGGATVNNAVIVKYDASGSGLWAISTDSGTDANNVSNFQAVAIANGSVYAAGIQSVPTSNPTSINYSGSIYVSGVQGCTNGVLVAYDSGSGEAQWARAVDHAGQTGSSNYYGVTVSGTDIYTVGDIYFDSGYNTDNFDFGNLQSVDGLDETVTHAVLVKYDSVGDAQWVAYPTTTPGNTSFSGVAVDSGGTVHAAGYQFGLGTYDYGTGITATGGSEFGNNALKVVYDSTGTVISARSAAVTASGESKFYAAAADGAGNVYAAGLLLGIYEYTFADGVSATGGNTSGGPNVAVVKYEP